MNLHLIVTGSRDEISPPGLIEAARHTWNPSALFEMIAGADHFYSGFVPALEDIIAAAV